MPSLNSRAITHQSVDITSGNISADAENGSLGLSILLGVVSLGSGGFIGLESDQESDAQSPVMLKERLFFDYGIYNAAIHCLLLYLLFYS